MGLLLIKCETLRQNPCPESEGSTEPQLKTTASEKFICKHTCFYVCTNLWFSLVGLESLAWWVLRRNG